MIGIAGIPVGKGAAIVGVSMPNSVPAMEVADPHVTRPLALRRPKNRLALPRAMRFGSLMKHVHSQAVITHPQAQAGFTLPPAPTNVRHMIKRAQTRGRQSWDN